MTEFWVPGVPVPQGSHRIYGGRVVDTQGSRLATWRATIGWQARAAGFRTVDSEHGWQVRCAFALVPPKRNRPRVPVRRPDVDKLARSVLDALTGVIWADDAQVVWLLVEKRWAGEPGPGVDIAAVPSRYPVLLA